MKILLTDDEAHVRHVMKYKLQRAGHVVLTAVNGEDALETARRARPNLVVSDQQMPLMTGLELSRELYADPKTREIPVILVTSRDRKSTRLNSSHSQISYAVFCL